MDGLLIAGIRALHFGPKGSDMEVLTTGSKFRALLARDLLLDPQTELRLDGRETAQMYVINLPGINTAPAALLSVSAHSQIPVRDVKTGQKWKVVKRDDNPVDFVVQFTIIKITAKDV